ncbi:hypothetical protein [Sphaerisporangium album]|uniref:hypothetical protein n=1 Tax=Sphaerisporangium album TaxID=509200 RepID=UPI0015F0B463|nr:hypothetical protein [Sphaerisporangium album]
MGGDDSSNVLMNIRFWHQVLEDSKRTIACSAADAPRWRAAVEAVAPGTSSKSS